MAQAVNRWRLKMKSRVRSCASLCHGVGRVAQALYGFATDWAVRGSNPGGSESRVVHLASCTMGTGFIFRGYGGRSVMLTNHLHVAPQLKSRAEPLLPLRAFMACSVVNFTATFYC